MDGGNSTQREAIFKKYEKRMYDYIGTEFEGKPINYEKFRKYFNEVKIFYLYILYISYLMLFAYIIYYLIY